MLKIVQHLRELDYSQLNAVYEQSNRRSGQLRYPRLSSQEQLLQAEQDFYNYLRECYFSIPQAFYYIWERDGCYQAAARLEPYHDGLLLTGLETAPSARCHGYATALLQSILSYIGKQSHVRIYSHVDKKNSASLSVHRHCGFQRMNEHAVCLDGSILRSACTLCIVVPDDT